MLLNPVVSYMLWTWFTSNDNRFQERQLDMWQDGQYSRGNESTLYTFFVQPICEVGGVFLLIISYHEHVSSTHQKRNRLHDGYMEIHASHL